MDSEKERAEKESTTGHQFMLNRIRGILLHRLHSAAPLNRVEFSNQPEGKYKLDLSLAAIIGTALLVDVASRDDEPGLASLV